MLLKSQATKAVKDFTDEEINNPKTDLMEPYVMSYFTEGSAKMIEKMQADGLCRQLPIIYIYPSKLKLSFKSSGLAEGEQYNPKVFRGLPLQVSTNDTTELKDLIAALFGKHRAEIKGFMADDKTYSRVFLHFLRMITDQTSELFDYKEWDRSEFFGAFKHFDLVDALEEIEGIFEAFFKDMNVKYEDV